MGGENDWMYFLLWKDYIKKAPKKEKDFWREAKEKRWSWVNWGIFRYFLIYPLAKYISVYYIGITVFFTIEYLINFLPKLIRGVGGGVATFAVIALWLPAYFYLKDLLNYTGTRNPIWGFVFLIPPTYLFYYLIHQHILLKVMQDGDFLDGFYNYPMLGLILFFYFVFLARIGIFITNKLFNMDNSVRHFFWKNFWYLARKKYGIDNFKFHMSKDLFHWAFNTLFKRAF